MKIFHAMYFALLSRRFLFRLYIVSITFLFQKNNFSDVARKKVILYWDAGHYYLESEKRNKPLTPLARFRIRERWVNRAVVQSNISASVASETFHSFYGNISYISSISIGHFYAKKIALTIDNEKRLVCRPRGASIPQHHEVFGSENNDNKL